MDSIINACISKLVPGQIPRHTLYAFILREKEREKNLLVLFPDACFGLKLGTWDSAEISLMGGRNLNTAASLGLHWQETGV